MSVIDILTRVESICKKYDKYDIDKQKDGNLAGAGDDAFARLYAAFETDIDATLQKSDAAASEKNRAAAVALNAEIRRTKARLLEEVPKLDRLTLKKDEGLAVISEGLETLKNMAGDMNEELDRQVPLVDEIDSKVDRATSDLKNTNVRLKHTVTQLRSSRNFCIDIILLCVILGIAAYLYNTDRQYHGCAEEVKWS
ncbi:hypothetical protein IFM89_019741 [Coptis chinensis]|uniref:t-SNARE coiled-coil homology domain-containing protein n=1 Tax=Coptis chinensis TaxID=261450 RepID=A0A835H6J7_9MAGN|nr:hypothetical protein IFM89_019741 [Coptis chinensis]